MNRKKYRTENTFQIKQVCDNRFLVHAFDYLSIQKQSENINPRVNSNNFFTGKQDPLLASPHRNANLLYLWK